MSALRVALGAALIGVITAAGVVYWEWDTLVPVAGLAVNYLRFFDAPKGTLTTERNGAQSAAQNIAVPRPARSPRPPAPRR